MIVVSASASNIKVEPFKSKEVAIVPVVIVGLVNKFAIVASFKPEALVSVSYTHLTLPTKRIV